MKLTDWHIALEQLDCAQRHSPISRAAQTDNRDEEYIAAVMRCFGTAVLNETLNEEISHWLYKKETGQIIKRLLTSVEKEKWHEVLVLSTILYSREICYLPEIKERCLLERVLLK